MEKVESFLAATPSQKAGHQYAPYKPPKQQGLPWY